MNKILFTVFLLTSCGSVPNSTNNTNANIARSQAASEKDVVIKKIFDTLTKRYENKKIKNPPSINGVIKRYEIIYNILTELTDDTITITPFHVKEYFAPNKNYDSDEAITEDVNRSIGTDMTTIFNETDKSSKNYVIYHQLYINLKNMNNVSYKVLKHFIDDLKTKLKMEDLSKIFKDKANKDIFNIIPQTGSLSLTPVSRIEVKDWSEQTEDSISNFIELIKDNIFNNEETNYLLLLLNLEEDTTIKPLLENRKGFNLLLNTMIKHIVVNKKYNINDDLIDNIKKDFMTKVKNNN